jgi:hypothetical protein
MVADTPSNPDKPPHCPPSSATPRLPQDVEPTSGPDGPQPVWDVIVVHDVGITKPGDTVYSFLSTIRALDAAPHGVGADVLRVGEPPEVSLLPCLPAKPPDPTA